MPASPHSHINMWRRPVCLGAGGKEVTHWPPCLPREARKRWRSAAEASPRPPPQSVAPLSAPVSPPAQRQPLQLTASPSSRQHEAGQVYRKHSSFSGQFRTSRTVLLMASALLTLQRAHSCQGRPPGIMHALTHQLIKQRTNAKQPNSLDDAKQHGEGVCQQVRIVQVQYQQAALGLQAGASRIVSRMRRLVIVLCPET